MSCSRTQCSASNEARTQGEHSAILSTFIKLPFVIKIFVLSIFERPFYTDFTAFVKDQQTHFNGILCL